MLSFLIQNGNGMRIETKIWFKTGRAHTNTLPHDRALCVNYEIHFQLTCILISSGGITAKTPCQPSFSKKAITFHMNTMFSIHRSSLLFSVLLYTQFIDQLLYAPISVVNTCVDRSEKSVRMEWKGGEVMDVDWVVISLKYMKTKTNWNIRTEGPVRQPIKKNASNNVSMQHSAVEYRWIQIEAVRCILLNIIVNAIWYFVIGHIQQIIVLYEYQKCQE